MQYLCKFCKTPIFPGAAGTWKKVTCWVKTGDRTATKIKQPEEHFDYAHEGCVDGETNLTESMF